MEGRLAQAKELSGEEKVAIWLVILVSAAIFFATAFSTADNLLKAVVIIADLYLSGKLIQSLSAAEGWHGIVMLRSKKGFTAMEDIARRYGRQAREIADFGMSLGYGIPFAYYLYKREPLKLAGHAVFLALFYWWLQGMPAAHSWLNQYTIAIGLSAGLLGLGMTALVSSTAGIFAAKTAPAAVAPVVPGVTLPFWEGLIAIGIVAAVHELAHGVLARVEKLPVLSSGLLLFGFLPIGAFVEPDEKKFDKLAIEKKRRILVVGTTSNFVFFLLFLALFFAASTALAATVAGARVASIEPNSTLQGMLGAGDVIASVAGQRATTATVFAAVVSGEPVKVVVEGGRQFGAPLSQLVVTDVSSNSPAEGKLKPNSVIESIDGKQVRTMKQAREILQSKQAGETVAVRVRGEESSQQIVLDENRRMGVLIAQSPAFASENKPAPGLEWLYGVLVFLAGVLGITTFLNFALAVINIMPIFSTDGYRIAREELLHALGSKREPLVRKVTVAASLFVLALIAVNLARWFKFF